MRRDSTIRDITLAPEGERKIRWVAQHAHSSTLSPRSVSPTAPCATCESRSDIAGGDGHPVEIMDLSFTVQALAIHYLARHHREPPPEIQPLPAEIDREIAAIKLETIGVSIDSLTAEQVDIRRRWQ
jgi:S-adenosylhomocysteine hydrolase